MPKPLRDLFGKELAAGDFCLLVNVTGSFGANYEPQIYKIKWIKPNKNGELCGMADRFPRDETKFGNNFQFSLSNSRKLMILNVSEVAQSLLTLTGEFSNQLKIDFNVDVDTMEV